MERIFRGIAASPGYTFGNVQILKPSETESFDETVAAELVDREIDAFLLGHRRCREYVQQLLEASLLQKETLTAQMLDGYKEMLTDDELINDISAMIRQKWYSAPAAVAVVFDEILREMTDIDDEYARQRADDIQKIQRMLLLAVQGKELERSSSLRFPQTVLVGNNLTPAETAALDKSHLAGLVSETGGVTSHIAIFSQNIGIPAAVGLHGILAELNDGDTVILDGCTGSVIVSPDGETSDRYKKKRAEYDESLRLLELLRDVPACAQNGFTVQLSANIGSVRDAEDAVKYGAEGIGLFRTEFLFMNRQKPPTEEEQFRAYRKVAEKMDGKPVTIRTLDIGGDKPIPGFSFPSEANPFLGWRACRIYEEHTELILPQLRAILRAAQYGNIKVMFPMIISLDEMMRMLDLLERTKKQLETEHISFHRGVPAGMMIETPAAALMIDDFLKLVDFCSIGTNDLTQYTLAVDRGNERVAALYDPMHPAVLKLIAHVIAAAHKQGKHVSICGELAANENAVPFFLDNRLEHISMTPARIPVIKNRIIRG